MTGVHEAQIREALRRSAFVSFALFGVSSSCTSTFYLSKNEAWLRPAALARNAFAASHAAHLAMILRLLWVADGSHPIKPISYLAGGPGYLTIGAMLRRGPRTAPLVHRFGEWFLLSLFAIAFAHGYKTKGRNARLYGPLAVGWALTTGLLQLSEPARREYERTTGAAAESESTRV